MGIEVKGEIGTEEWWINIRKLREDIATQLTDFKLKGLDSCDDYRKWVIELRQVEKMIGDANGVFVKDTKALVNQNENVKILVIMPDGNSTEKKVEKAKYEEIIDDSATDAEVYSSD